MAVVDLSIGVVETDIDGVFATLDDDLAGARFEPGIALVDQGRNGRVVERTTVLFADLELDA